VRLGRGAVGTYKRRLKRSNFGRVETIEAKKYSAHGWLHNTIARDGIRREDQRVYVSFFRRALRLTTRSATRRNTPAMPFPLCPLSVKNVSTSMLPISRREPCRSWKAPKPHNPALTRRNMPLRGCHLYFATDHDRPITESFLDRWRGRAKLSREGVAIAARGRVA
jgi:hypothetical protein